MRTIWQSLAWKEWHEHKWKLAAMTAILFGLSATALLFNLGRDTFQIAYAMMMFGAFPLTLFIAAGEATTENARGTMAFTQSLPTPMWRTSTQKLLFGWLTCILPILIALVALASVYLICASVGLDKGLRLLDPSPTTPRPISAGDWLWATLVPILIAATSMYLWTVAIGVNRKDEVSAGAWALLGMVVWWTAVVGLMRAFDLKTWGGDPATRDLTDILFAPSPGGMAILWSGARYARESHHWLHVTIAIVMHVALASWYILRFGRTPDSEVRSPRTATGSPTTSRMDHTPWRWPIAAIAWKQYRESRPIVLVGLAAIVGVAGFIFWMESNEFRRQTAGEIIAVVSCYFGVVLTMVVGIGVFLNDLSPGLCAFWRSRPIQPDSWFWTKLVMGLVVLLIAFVVPVSIAFWLGGIKDSQFVDVGPWVIVTPLWIYSAMVLMTCLVRHGIYSAILGLAAMYLGLLTVATIIRAWKYAAGGVAWAEFWDVTEFEIAVAMIVSTVVFTMAAWLAMRYDWGRKSRY